MEDNNKINNLVLTSQTQPQIYPSIT